MLIRNALSLVALLACASIGLAQESKPQVDMEVKPAFVKMETSEGDIYIELDRAKAPKSVENFLRYTDEEFYDGTVFHRVISTFMIQGGGFDASLNQKKTHKPIDNEWQNGLKNMRGTIAMARTQAPNSATAQFYINVKDNPNLDQPISGGAGYAVFGKVIAGMDTVDKIKVVPTSVGTGPHGQRMRDVPVTPVVIEKVRKITKEQAKEAMDAEKASQGAPAQSPTAD